MKTKLVLLLILGAAVCGRAAESGTFSIVDTNWRSVEGKNYHVGDESWVTVFGRFERAHAGGIILVVKQPDEVIAITHNPDGTQSRMVRPVPDKFIFVKNFASTEALKPRQMVKCAALPIAEVPYQGVKIEAWDCGVVGGLTTEIKLTDVTLSSRVVVERVPAPREDQSLRPIRSVPVVNAPQSEEEFIFENLGPAGKAAYLAGRLRQPTFPLTPEEMDIRLEKPKSKK